jgi:hypothetical protein
MKDFWASVKVGKSDFWLISPPEREKLGLAYSVFIVKNIKDCHGRPKEKGCKVPASGEDGQGFEGRWIDFV